MPVSPNSIINLSAASLLLAESTSQGMEILAQVCMGFGVRSPHRCTRADEAMALLSKTPIDLMICEAELGDSNGYDLIKWLRRSNLDPNATVPVVMISGHTPLRKILLGRDSGANAMVAKPLRPKTLLDRILWLASDRRDFIICDHYAGPDRRWQNLGPPPGERGRRGTDLSPDIGMATDPNLDQSDIDSMFRPTKATI
jgi:DNA-binding response OmpR family regulator